MAEYLENCEASEYDLLLKDDKGLSQVNEFVTVANAKGIRSREFLQQVDASMHFLSLPPICKLDLPAWMVQDVHCARVKEASGLKFWQAVASETLAANKFKAEEIAAVQIKLATEKVIELTRNASKLTADLFLRGPSARIC